MGGVDDSLDVVASAVLDGLERPAVALGTDYRILAANRAYRELFGNGANIVGHRGYSVSHLERLREALARLGAPAAR